MADETDEPDSAAHPFTRLTPDLVMDATESVGFRCDARILELNSYENRVYQIGIEDDEPVIGKFYRPERWTEAQILEEHTFTQLLADSDISAVPPMIIDGSTLHEFDGYRFSLSPRRGGRAPAVDDLGTLEILGSHIGRIHAVAGEGGFTHRPLFGLQEFGLDARDAVVAAGYIPTELMPAFDSLYDGILADLAALFERVSVNTLRLHGDCHMGNVLWRDDLPHFVDFDDARSGPAIQDLWMMLSGEREQQQNQMMHILRGYRQFNHFNLAELQLIEGMRALRMIHHVAWIARRWDDPAFPRAFPFFDSERFWSEHLLSLKEQWARLSEPAIEIFD
ncbi:MAG: serine/threonine protein kinase [Pseudomonadota bacterium]